MLFALDRFPKVGAPGEDFEYSETGYNLLGEIIERKTGVVRLRRNARTREITPLPHPKNFAQSLMSPTRFSNKSPRR